MRLTRWTLDRWIRMWQQGGFDALVPSPRQSQPRTPPEVMELAVALKKENPARTAAQVQRILRAQGGWAPDETTIQRMFRRTGLTALTPAADAPAFGRWEASRPNEIWTGDAMHAIRLQGRKTYLFAFIDDHSRAVMAARFGFAEDAIRLAAALRPALASRGIPAHAYVDNGSAFVDTWLLRACAKLRVKLIHSQPRRPEGKGKIERFFRTVRDQFLVELTEERAARIPQLLLQGLDLGVALPLHRFDASLELVLFVPKLVARVLDSRLEPGLPLRRGFLEFRLQRGQLLAVRGDLLFIVGVLDGDPIAPEHVSAQSLHAGVDRRLPVLIEFRDDRGLSGEEIRPTPPPESHR